MARERRGRRRDVVRGGKWILAAKYGHPMSANLNPKGAQRLGLHAHLTPDHHHLRLAG